MAQPWPAWAHTVNAAVAHGPAQVGVVEDHEGRLAAELEEDLLERLGGRRHDLPAGGRRAGEADLVHPGVGRQQRAHRVLGRGHDVDHARGDVGLLGDEPPEHRGAPRGVRRRLEHHGVARGQGRPQLGQVDLVGHVPGGDGAHHPGGLAPHPPVGGDAEGRGVPEVGLPLRSPRPGRPPIRATRPAHRAGPSRSSRAASPSRPPSWPGSPRRGPRRPPAAGGGPGPAAPRRSTTRSRRRPAGPRPTASSRSSGPPSATTPSTSSVAGLTTSKVRPDRAARSWPSMSSRSSPTTAAGLTPSLPAEAEDRRRSVCSVSVAIGQLDVERLGQLEGGPHVLVGQ